MERRARKALWVAVAVLLAGGLALGWRQHVALRRTAILRADPQALLADPAALADGRRVFAAHCAACHGAQGRGDPRQAAPNLADRDFLYGQGRVGEIEQIVLHGIRAGDTKGWNLAEMPGFAKAVPYAREKLPSLDPRQIDDLVGFLRAANGDGGVNRERMERGRNLFAKGAACWDCHGFDGSGDPAVGAPNLIDGIWLKGSAGEADIARIIAYGMAGVSPAFQHRLSAYDARVVAAYTASLHP